MKITTKFLKSIGACEKAISLFDNIIELHDIDIESINTLTVEDVRLFNDIQWLILKLKGKLKINKLSYKDSYGSFNECTYDENGNRLTFKDSNGFSCECTYDERNNMLTSKNSYGYSEEYTYDERNNRLALKNSDGYSEEYTYDENGNKLTYKNSDGKFKEYTYDEKYNLNIFIIN